MLLLAIETSSRRGSVALFGDDGLLRESVFPEGLIHGREITVRIDDLLRQEGKTARSLTAIAVGLGPGSFTGIRVGVTTAKAMSFALRIPVLVESSLRITAANAVPSGVAGTGSPGEQGPPGRILTVLDARQGAWFWAVHEAAGSASGSDSAVCPLLPDAAGEPSAIADAVRGLGGDGVVIGEGADAFLARSPGFPWPRGPGPWDLPTARRLGEMAAVRAAEAAFDGELTHRLEPAYLRATEAERKLEARRGK